MVFALFVPSQEILYTRMTWIASLIDSPMRATPGFNAKSVGIVAGMVNVVLVGFEKTKIDTALSPFGSKYSSCSRPCHSRKCAISSKEPSIRSSTNWCESAGSCRWSHSGLHQVQSPHRAIRLARRIAKKLALGRTGALGRFTTLGQSVPAPPSAKNKT